MVHEFCYRYYCWIRLFRPGDGQRVRWFELGGYACRRILDAWVSLLPIVIRHDRTDANRKAPPRLLNGHLPHLPQTRKSRQIGHRHFLAQGRNDTRKSCQKQYERARELHPSRMSENRLSSGASQSPLLGQSPPLLCGLGIPKTPRRVLRKTLRRAGQKPLVTLGLVRCLPVTGGWD